MSHENFPKTKKLAFNKKLTNVAQSLQNLVKIMNLWEGDNNPWLCELDWVKIVDFCLVTFLWDTFNVKMLPIKTDKF